MLKPLSTEELKLLQFLEEDSNRSYDELAQLVSVSKEKIEAMISELQAEKIILKYRAIINWEK